MKLGKNALMLSGILILITLAGSPLVDALWLALVPSAIALAIGMQKWAGAATSRVERICSVIIAGAAAALVALALIGMFTHGSLRIEPAWLTTATQAAGWTLTGSLAVLGVELGRTRTIRPVLAGLSVMAIPLGLVLDRALATLPAGFIFSSAGFYIGAGLLAIVLIRLARVGQRGTASIG